MKFLDKNPVQKEILLGSQFGKLLKDGFKICSSAGFLHYLLSRQLVTKKQHEIWILFGEKPFRYSIHEFDVATGLICSKPPDKSEENEGMGGEGEEVSNKEGEETISVEEVDAYPYWSELFEGQADVTPKQICAKLKSKKVDATKKLKLSCLLLVDIILLPTSGEAKIINSHVRMIRDLDVFLHHPWGRECFAFAMMSIQSKKEASMCQQRMAIQGFIHGLQLVALSCIHGLQLVALSCIPDITLFATTDANKQKKSNDSEIDSDDEEYARPLKINMNMVGTLDTERQVKVAYTLAAEGIEGEDISFSDDDDDKVVHLVGLCEKNHRFTVSSWSGGVDAAAIPLEKEDGAKQRRGKRKCDAADPSPHKKDKGKGKKSENKKGQTSATKTTLPTNEMQDLIDDATNSCYQKFLDTLEAFDVKFTGPLKQQDVSIKKELKDMSEKIKDLSNQVFVLKSQQPTANPIQEPVNAAAENASGGLPQSEENV